MYICILILDLNVLLNHIKMPFVPLVSNYLDLLRKNSIEKREVHKILSERISNKIYESYIEKKTFCNFEFPLDVLDDDKTILKGSLDDYLCKLVYETIVLDNNLHGISFSYSKNKFTFGFTWY